ncbi:uncharacterized protein (DUF2141 family) [Novosphingobium chloroacetimidivorans]|uniref:Uncharacterized protein (DUF2141 family) n=1 Tax=Novosphingobium chloroacetimidivorans TaxID=1428314 RepID=A0A7W7K827_9SPHN|nr:DUF2141 domain-containing protein [Novosphingobium chloroacetimidivorans]MBB4857987.1 uncharacterized protein (DUF2141 family) [Novosphingobium chloroacetimidivorans]
MRDRSRTVAALIAAAALPALVGAVQPSTDVSASVTGLRSAKGHILACLTMRPDTFPNCQNDPAAKRLIVPATAPALDFGKVTAGRYAIALIHDENANGKLDKRLMIPREGFGFSQDAPVVMGPPRFDSAAFPVNGFGEHLTIKMRYLF